MNDSAMNVISISMLALYTVLPGVFFLILGLVKKKKDFIASSIACFGIALSFAAAYIIAIVSNTSGAEFGFFVASGLQFLALVPLAIVAFVKKKRALAISSIILSVSVTAFMVYPIIGRSYSISQELERQTNNSQKEEGPEYFTWMAKGGFWGEISYDGSLYVQAYPQNLVQNEDTIKQLEFRSRTSDSPIISLGWKDYYYKATASMAADGGTFSTGERIVGGKDYFFRIERIKWRKLDSKSGVTMAITEKIIDASPFPETLFDALHGVISSNYPYDWEYISKLTSIRSTLADYGAELFPNEKIAWDEPLPWTYENNAYCIKNDSRFSTCEQLEGRYSLPCYRDAENVINSVDGGYPEVTDYALAMGAGHDYWLRSLNADGTPQSYPIVPEPTSLEGPLDGGADSTGDVSADPNEIHGIRPVAVWPIGIGL